MITIFAEEMRDLLFAVFRKYGFNDKDSRSLAEVHTENTLHGINSHGINRVPQFLEYVKKGIVKIDRKAQKIEAFGTMERWDGKQGSGVLNALRCTDRAVELAKEHGMGLIALKNTNHWMRGGFYGWQAAKQDCIAILFTNTKPNMPAWGAKESSIGNNPFVVAIPRKEGHVVLDMALSQYSFGKINEYRLRGEKLPFPGGWDENNQLSTDPEKLLKKERGLPIGYWKGSAFSMILDMLATVLSAGKSTSRIAQKELETNISQVYLCIFPEVFHDREIRASLINEIIDFTRDCNSGQDEDKTYYPGERSAYAREYNSKNGMKVDEEIWKGIQQLVK
jgi:3-dehydro-L-gulonate 2-dehydrogenase